MSEQLDSQTTQKIALSPERQHAVDMGGISPEWAANLPTDYLTTNIPVAKGTVYGRRVTQTDLAATYPQPDESSVVGPASVPAIESAPLTLSELTAVGQPVLAAEEIQAGKHRKLTTSEETSKPKGRKLRAALAVGCLAAGFMALGGAHSPEIADRTQLLITEVVSDISDIASTLAADAASPSLW